MVFSYAIGVTKSGKLQALSSNPKERKIKWYSVKRDWMIPNISQCLTFTDL
jgi:hypothetical protein